VSEPDLQAVRDFFQGFNEQDLDLFLASLDPEAELHTLKMGQIQGHEAARHWATRPPGGLQQRIVVEDLLQSGDRLVALARQQWLWEGTDEIAEDNEVAAVFSLRNGRIVRWQPFPDRAEALRVAGIEPAGE
jgi:ketosteroid isomerase-like protein